MNIHLFILTPAVQMNEFQSYIISLPSLHLDGYIMLSQNDELPVGMITQLEEHCTGITKVMG